MSSMITNMASPEAGGEPNPGIVQIYRARLQAIGHSQDRMDRRIRTIRHLITWLSANGAGIETLDVRVLHQFLHHDCACPGPHGYRKNPERAGPHLRRFPGFLMEAGRVRIPPEIEAGGRVVESFLRGNRNAPITRAARGLPDSPGQRHGRAHANRKNRNPETGGLN